jgi:general secretion pathway protein D
MQQGMGAQEEEEPEYLLWIESDEYGRLADTGKNFVLFYPLRYHGGFEAQATGTAIERVEQVKVSAKAPDEIVKQLKDVLGVDAVPYSSLNLLVIKMEREREELQKVKELLDVLDAPRKQVSIEAKIVEISREDEVQLGIDWTLENTRSDFFRGADGSLDIVGSPLFGTRDFNLRFDTAPSGSALQLEATIRALEAMSKLNVISEPTMVVEVGETARILVGQEVPIATKWSGRAGSENVTTQLREVGVRLLVTPLTVSEDTIRLQVWPEVSSVQQFRTTDLGIENPVLDVRNAQTTVSVQDGEFIKIGGLLSNTQAKNEIKVPLLGDIPFLGALFKSWRYDEVQQDLIIYITPRIVRGPLIQPGAGIPFIGVGP